MADDKQILPPIAAIWAAKWKTFIQLIWQGAAYFWFWLATLAAEHAWGQSRWHKTSLLLGSVSTLMMFTAIALTLYSLYVYMRDYGYLLRTRPLVDPDAGHPRG